jgi:pimeloyl-ACP methyl ester carboxylesterase
MKINYPDGNAPPMRIVGLFFLFILITTSAFSQSLPANQYFDSNGVRIRYIELGSGEPVIAIHGFTRDSDSWLASISDLAEDHRLILFDQRGHGLSDKPHSVSEYGREMGHDVIRLMDHLNISEAHILGYSIGVAPIAMVITENEERFISAIFGGGAARWEWGNESDLLNQHTYQRMLTSPRRLQLEPAWEGQDQIALANLRLGEKELVVSRESIANLSIPILAIVGSEDLSLGAVRNFKNLLPAMELHVIEGESHVSTPRHPDFVTSIRGFLARSANR